MTTTVLAPNSVAVRCSHNPCSKSPRDRLYFTPTPRLLFFVTKAAAGTISIICPRCKRLNVVKLDQLVLG